MQNFGGQERVLWYFWKRPTELVPRFLSLRQASYFCRKIFCCRLGFKLSTAFVHPTSSCKQLAMCKEDWSWMAYPDNSQIIVHEISESCQYVICTIFFIFIVHVLKNERSILAFVCRTRSVRHFYFLSDYLTTIADWTGGKRFIFGYPTNPK